MPQSHLKKPPAVVLACIDGSNVTQSVCDYAAWYGNKLGLSVALLHAIDIPKSRRHDFSGTIGMDSRKQLMEELTALDEQKARASNKYGEALLKDAKVHILASYASKANDLKIGDLKVHTHLRHDKLLPAIEHYAPKARVIIMGRRGQDHQNHNNQQHNQVNLGSHIETVVRAMHQPILICSADFATPTSFMLAFDGSATAKKAVEMICASQLAQGATGHIVMVANTSSSKDSVHEDELYEAQQRLKQAGLDVTAHLLNKTAHKKDVVGALTTFQAEHDIDMIVIGAYGHSKLRQFFVGSTTTKLLASTTAPVLLLR